MYYRSLLGCISTSRAVLSDRGEHTNVIVHQSTWPVQSGRDKTQTSADEQKTAHASKKTNEHTKKQRNDHRSRLKSTLTKRANERDTDDMQQQPQRRGRCSGAAAPPNFPVHHCRLVARYPCPSSGGATHSHCLGCPSNNQSPGCPSRTTNTTDTSAAATACRTTTHPSSQPACRSRDEHVKDQPHTRNENDDADHKDKPPNHQGTQRVEAPSPSSAHKQGHQLGADAPFQAQLQILANQDGTNPPIHAAQHHNKPHDKNSRLNPTAYAASTAATAGQPIHMRTCHTRLDTCRSLLPLPQPPLLSQFTHARPHGHEAIHKNPHSRKNPRHQDNVRLPPWVEQEQGGRCGANTHATNEGDDSRADGLAMVVVDGRWRNRPHRHRPTQGSHVLKRPKRVRAAAPSALDGGAAPIPHRVSTTIGARPGSPSERPPLVRSRRGGAHQRHCTVPSVSGLPAAATRGSGATRARDAYLLNHPTQLASPSFGSARDATSATVIWGGAQRRWRREGLPAPVCSTPEALATQGQSRGQGSEVRQAGGETGTDERGNILRGGHNLAARGKAGRKGSTLCGDRVPPVVRCAVAARPMSAATRAEGIIRGELFQADRARHGFSGYCGGGWYQRQGGWRRCNRRGIHYTLGRLWCPSLRHFRWCRRRQIRRSRQRDVERAGCVFPHTSRMHSGGPLRGARKERRPSHNPPGVTANNGSGGGGGGGGGNDDGGVRGHGNSGVSGSGEGGGGHLHQRARPAAAKDTAAAVSAGSDSCDEGSRRLPRGRGEVGLSAGHVDQPTQPGW